ncbi:hypothetical protein GCM10022232_82200 [Streptomyces plumbiresistens]|uniref:Uncharacterized protein n=1 Tax=Streptomyces plumbiresistens TaxID=511811 RepID=A0ABP7TES3_9ACTN
MISGGRPGLGTARRIGDCKGGVLYALLPAIFHEDKDGCAAPPDRLGQSCSTSVLTPGVGR